MILPDDKVEEIRAASDIVEVVSDYVRLKRRGSNFIGLCPFHGEKTPSFNVNPSLGIFKCFGCGVGGDVFSFLMRVESVGFTEAARLLAERAGIVLPQEQPGPVEAASETESIYAALRFAARFFFHHLTQTEEGKRGLAYFRKRGFSGQTIKAFGLGYAPEAWEALLQAAAGQHLPAETLEKAGLVIPRKDGGGYYDRYRGRVIFPILSPVGKVLGFGGRILDAAPDQPKYINSPETKVYHKGQVLYGLYQAKQAIRRKEEVILVEGYTDVISLHQAGVQQVVASSGTALTVEQVRALGRYAKRILLLYDADTAGTNAALRGIDLILEQGLMVYAVALPPGEDPDSFVQQHGGVAFEEYVQKHRQDFVAFAYGLARRTGVVDTPEGKAEVQRNVVASVAKIADPLMQESYLRRASEVLDVPDIYLRQVLDALHRASRPRPIPPVEARHPPAGEAITPVLPDAPAAMVSSPAMPPEKILLRLMLMEGLPLVEFVLGHMGVEEFSEGASRDVIGHLLAMYEAGQIDARPMLDGSLGEAVQALAAEVLMETEEPSENWKRRHNITVSRDDPNKVALGAMVLLKKARVDEAIDQQRQRIFQAAQQGADLHQLQEEMMALHQLRKQIEQRAFLHWE
jgi:DNA primase